MATLPPALLDRQAITMVRARSAPRWGSRSSSPSSARRAPSDAVSTPSTRAWELMAIPATAAGLTALALGRVRARNPEAVVALAARGGVSCSRRAMARPSRAPPRLN